MMNDDYKIKLEESAKMYNNILCMGLDPVVEHLPEEHREKGIAGFANYFREICTELKRREIAPAAFKPNLGFYTKHDDLIHGNFEGSVTLGRTITLANFFFPHVPLILDSKRGDITTSSANYINGDLKICDSVTLHSYMGSDTIEPMKSHPKKGAYVLVRTSNPSSNQIQNLGEGEVYKSAAQLVENWSTKNNSSFINENLGMVIGATQRDELEEIVKLHPDIPLLIPGVGSQGGSATDVMKILKEKAINFYHHRFNSSSGITHPWAKKKEQAPSNPVKVAVDRIEEYIRACKDYF